MADDSAGPQTVMFLQALFGDRAPEGARIALWERAGKTSRYIDLPGEAASAEGETDVYLHAGLAPVTMTNTHRRIKARECTGIPGVWIDIDVNGGPDGKTGRAKDRATALELASTELEPSCLINSGYGLQAWWLFDDPWMFGTDHERERAGRITQGWETIHRNHALRHGYGLDSTHDLARLMRLPGTLNGKGDKTAPVEIIELQGPRYTLDRISEVALTVAPIGVTEVKVDPKAGFPKAKFDALIDNHDFFRKTWEHRRKDREAENWSLSEYDLALASIAISVNWTDDEVAALIREHREAQGSPVKGTRADYLERTISRAHQQMHRNEQVRLQASAHEDVVRAQERGNLTSDLAYSKLNQAWGAGADGRVPTVKELVQYSEDPDEARYVIVFASGSEANVGPYKNLRNIRLLDERLAPVIGISIPRLKDEIWRDHLNSILPYRTVREEPEPQVLNWIRTYLQDRLMESTSRDEAAKAGEPFVEDGILYIRAEGLATFIRMVLKDRIRPADLRPLLRAAGFEPHTVHHDKPNGRGPTTSSYWRAPHAEID